MLRALLLDMQLSFWAMAHGPSFSACEEHGGELKVAVATIIGLCPHDNAPIGVPFVPSEVSTACSWKVTQVQHLRGFPESVLKSKLDITRLTAAATKAVCVIPLPSLQNPNVCERFFCFH